MWLPHYLRSPALDGAGVATDPYWANVVLLAGNNNGANNSTTFTDQSASVHTLTANGTAKWSTLSAPTGLTSSELGDGNGDFVASDSTADFTLGTGDFTIEGWMNFSTANGTFNALCDFRALGQNSSILPSIWRNNDVNGSLIVFVGGTSVITGGATSSGTWYHYALSRISGTTKAFLAGSQVGSNYTDSNSYVQGTPAFGGSAAAPTLCLNGYHGPLRITKGVGRYSGAFTPPTLPLPTA